jgi:hypothetical protein
MSITWPGFEASLFIIKSSNALDKEVQLELAFHTPADTLGQYWVDKNSRSVPAAHFHPTGG